MKILTSTDLKNWSGTLECQSQIPLLIRKLVYAGVDIDDIKMIDFPFAEDVQTGGYDGQLEVEKGNSKIPDGASVWEFGVVETGKKAKADDDYNKRKADPLGRNPSDTTYVNVTLKKYSKKQEWMDEKNAEGFWADVRFYDAVDIEHWLDLAPSVEIWLARLLGKPVVGVQCAGDYWEQWSTKEDQVFPYELLLGSRDEQRQQIVDFLLDNNQKVRRIKSNTREESLAFILAVIESLNDDEKNAICSKALVVENLDSYRQLVESQNKLILLPKFRLDDVDINRTMVKGHKLIIPLSNSFTSNDSNIILLPIVRSEAFRDGLKKMGINSEQAQLLSVTTGKDISVLRRNLQFSSKQPIWFELNDPLRFVPFLLAARFDAGYEGDREIIEKISKSEYTEYEKYLKKILNGDETPIYNIGTKWRLISHADSWLYLAKFITDEDLESFYKIAVEVLTESNPKYGLDPEKRYMASFYKATPKYSNYLIKGICETLILLSVLAKKYGLNTITDPESFVDRLMGDIMSSADGILLRSLSDNLSLLAEASPGVFVKSIQNAIENKKVEGFFEQENDLLHSTTDLPYLLWALERVAWMPEYLTSVVRIICQLINISPNELPSSNTPFNSLVSIFRLWLPQTNATMEERRQILEILKKEYPNIAFSLFKSLVYKHHDTAFNSSKMRWRLFSETREAQITHQELHYMYAYAVDTLIELARGADISRALVIIDKLDTVNWDKIDPMLDCLESYLNETEENKARVYHSLRKLVGRHRTYHYTNWAMPEAVLTKIEKTAIKFKPQDLLLSKIYLFEEHHPELMEGYPKDLKEDYHKQEEMISKLRVDAIHEFLGVTDLKELIGLATSMEIPYLFANAFAKVELALQVEQVIFDLIESEDDKQKWFFSSWMSSKERFQGREWALTKIREIIEANRYKTSKLAYLYLPLNLDLELCKHIDALGIAEIEQEYWGQISPVHFPDMETLKIAIKKFQKLNRPLSILHALGRARYIKEELSSEYIVSTLDNLNLGQYNEPPHIRVDHYLIREVFSNLHNRYDVDEQKMAENEMKFLFIFDKYGSGILPKYLYKAIAQTPSLFMDLIKQIFKPKNEKLLEQENIEYSEEQRKMIFENAYGVISNFNLIPGLQPDGIIIEEELNNWIDQLRELAVVSGHEGITDSLIGQILGRYPHSVEDKSFPDVIYNVLERLNNIDIYGGFGNQIFNRMGVTSRGVDSGGNIERVRADHFNQLAEKLKITHPNVAEVYRGLARNYQHHAKREDEQALITILEY